MIGHVLVGTVVAKSPVPCWFQLFCIFPFYYLAPKIQESQTEFMSKV